MGKAIRESFIVSRLGKSAELGNFFCFANLIIALKLLANQQEDGDGLLQNIVKDPGRKFQKDAKR